MLYKLNRQGQATEYIIMPDGGPMINLGDRDKAEDIASELLSAILYPNSFPLPDLPELPAEEPCYTVPEAVSAAITFEIINGLNTSRRRLTDSIRSAARAGRITGAYRTPEGYWRLPVAAFNAWIASYSEQKRGRPRKEAAAVAEAPEHHSITDQLDAYTVHIWRNRVSGELYAVKRDSTGIVVGAFGPLDVAAARDIRVWNADWSLDLAHSLRVDRILGAYEEVVIGDV